MRLLWVGDVHATSNDLDDCRALQKLILEVVKKDQAIVFFAGDLYDSMRIVHTAVQLFWSDFFEELKGDTILIAGNHDQPGIQGSRETSLVAHRTQVDELVAWKPLVRNNVLFCPYTTNEQLVAWSQAQPECGTLICHATFAGSKYDNGFYAPDGINPKDIAQARIVSGHIHSAQQFGKVWYPGSPRWRNLNDANQDKALQLLEFDVGGNLISSLAIDTGTHCRRIIRVQDTPASPFDIKARPAPKDALHVEIKGPQSWIVERKPLFEGWARIRTIKTDTQSVTVRESDGIPQAFAKYVNAFQPKFKTNKDTLRQMVKERLHGF